MTGTRLEVCYGCLGKFGQSLDRMFFECGVHVHVGSNKLDGRLQRHENNVRDRRKTDVYITKVLGSPLAYCSSTSCYKLLELRRPMCHERTQISANCLERSRIENEEKGFRHGKC